MMPTLSCPNCGGANTYDGTSASLPCQYCGTLVPLPDEVRAAQNMQQMRAAGGMAGRYIVIILLVGVGLPTCLAFASAVAGLGLSLIGLVVGLAAPILALLLQAAGR
jgi:hypothetical protein